MRCFSDWEINTVSEPQDWLLLSQRWPLNISELLKLTWKSHTPKSKEPVLGHTSLNWNLYSLGLKLRGIKIWQRTTCLKNNEPARPKQPSADLWKEDTVSSGKVHAQEDWLMLHMDLHLSGTQWHCTELEAGLKEEQTANCYKSKPIVRR